MAQEDYIADGRDGAANEDVDGTTTRAVAEPTDADSHDTRDGPDGDRVQLRRRGGIAELREDKGHEEAERRGGDGDAEEEEGAVVEERSAGWSSCSEK